jgi:tetratricopeptide (TPR) repeat protein
VLTCAHVVSLALGRGNDTSRPTEALLVDFLFPLREDPKRIPAMVGPWFPIEANGGGDIAGLILQQPPPADARPVTLVDMESPWGKPIRAFGFPAGRPGGAWSTGRVLDVEGTGWLQVDAVTTTGRRIGPGYSGAPVWLDEDLPGVVGMVVAADQQDRDRVAFMIPAADLAEAWPAVLKQRPMAACPYQGLLHFGEGDAEFFFGRDEDRVRLVGRVRSQPLIAVLGASGSGKSSVVFAGLLPELRRDSNPLVAAFRPHSDPFREVAFALLPLLEPGIGGVSLIRKGRELREELRAGELPVVVERILAAHGTRELLLVADQFEELYTSCDAGERQAFLDALIPPTTPVAWPTALRVVLTMRDDFYPHAIEHPAFRRALEQSVVNLGPMTREQLRQVIEEPSRRRSVTFADDLVDRILDDIGHGPGALPLLEFALTRLWEQQRSGRLDHPGYAAIGRVSGALTKYADEAYQSLSDADQARAQHVLVDQLVATSKGSEPTRRIAARAAMSEEDWAVVQRLADKRLVVTDRDPAGRETAQIAHEALIQGWAKLRDWVTADHDFLVWYEEVRARIRLWEDSGHDPGDLLSGARLSRAEEWCAERADRLAEPIVEFVRASRHGQAEELLVSAGNYRGQGMQDEAIDRYERASAIYAELGQPDRQLYALRWLVALHVTQDQPGPAMRRYREILELPLPETAVKEATGELLGFIAAHSDPLSWYCRALVVHRRIGERHGEARIRSRIASTYFKNHDVGRALRHASRAMKSYQELDEWDEVLWLLNNLIEVHAKRGEVLPAIRYYQTDARLFPPENRREQLGELMSIAPKIAFGLGVWFAAYLAALIVYAILGHSYQIGSLRIGPDGDWLTTSAFTIHVGGLWVTRIAVAAAAIVLAGIVWGRRARLFLAAAALIAVGEGWLWLLDKSEHGFVLGVLSGLLLRSLALGRSWAPIRPYTRALRTAARWLRHKTIDRIVVGDVLRFGDFERIPAEPDST